MNDNDKYYKLYETLLEDLGSLHERIKVGIRQGLRMIIILTVLFMALMFLTKGSKGIFLVLWIAGCFAVAAFLIALDYVDHGLQKRIGEIMGMENEIDHETIMPQLALHLQEHKAQRQNMREKENESAQEEKPADSGDTVSDIIREIKAEEEKAPFSVPGREDNSDWEVGQ